MDEEAKPESEWVQYNDDYLKHMRENWKGIINDCVEIQAYPTVLLYEKLGENDGYEPRQTVSEGELEALVEVAEVAEAESSEMIDMFS